MFKHDIEINGSEALTDAQLDVISGGIVILGKSPIPTPVCNFPSHPVYGDNPLSNPFNPGQEG
jgi:hypothetical protein